MRTRLLIACTFFALVASSTEADAKKKKEKLGVVPMAQGAAAGEPGQPPAPVTDAEINSLLSMWPSFREAMDELGRAVPAGESGSGLDAAEAALAADERVRGALRGTGHDPDAFLETYRRVSAAWWAMRQQGDFEMADRVVAKELAELEKVSGRDPEAKAVVEEMQKSADAHRARRQDEAAVPAASVHAVRKRHVDLSAIFEAK